MLKLIDGGKQKSELVTCPKCGCMSWVDVTNTIRRENGKNTQGIKSKACLGCMAKGLLTQIPGG